MASRSHSGECLNGIVPGEVVDAGGGGVRSEMAAFKWDKIHA
jgi:hypothetical protein